MLKIISILLFMLFSLQIYSQSNDGKDSINEYKWLVYASESSFDQFGNCKFDVEVKIDTINNLFITINESYAHYNVISFGKIKQITPDKYVLVSEFSLYNIPSIIKYDKNDKIPEGIFQVILINQNENWVKENDRGICLRLNNDTIKEKWIQIRDTMNLKNETLNSLQIIDKFNYFSFSKHIIPSDTINQAIIEYDDKYFYNSFDETNQDTIIFIDNNRIKWNQPNHRDYWYQLKKTSIEDIRKTSPCLGVSIEHELYEELDKMRKKVVIPAERKIIK